MTTLHEGRSEQRGKLSARLSVGAALCVLGLASLVWWHDHHEMSAALPGAFVAADTPAATAFKGLATVTGVPTAESVFRGRGYIAPDAPIAQF